MEKHVLGKHAQISKCFCRRKNFLLSSVFPMTYLKSSHFHGTLNWLAPGTQQLEATAAPSPPPPQSAPVLEGSWLGQASFCQDAQGCSCLLFQALTLFKRQRAKQHSHLLVYFPNCWAMWVAGVWMPGVSQVRSAVLALPPPPTWCLLLRPGSQAVALQVCVCGGGRKSMW